MKKFDKTTIFNNNQNFFRNFTDVGFIYCYLRAYK